MKTMRFLAGPLLILLTILAFWPMFRNGFVWDDQEFIVRNPAIRGLWPPSRFFASHGSAAEGAIYPMTGQRPVMVFSLALDYALWQRNPWGFHLTNFLLHLLCVAGTWLLVRKTSRSPEAGFLAGLLFAVHPGHAEGVISFLGRSDLLAALFVLLGFYGYLKFRDQGKSRRMVWFGLALLSFLLGCFSKETGLVLLGLLVVYEAFFSGHSQSNPQNLKSKMARLLPFLVVATGYWLFRGRVLGGQSAGSAWWGGTPYTNFLMMFEVYARYIRLLVFPAPLSPLHTVPVPVGWWDVRVLWGLGLFLGTVVAMIGMLRRTPWTGFFLAWFLFGLIPVANLIPIPGVMIMAERWLYLPSLGACALAGWGAWVVWSRSRGWTQRVWFALVAVVLFLFIARTRSWNPIWKTEESVALAVVATSPETPIGYNNLGNALLAKGQTGGALAAFRRALELKLDYAEAHNNYGMALAKRGESEEALREFKEALRLKPNLATAHNNLGIALREKGQIAESRAELFEALRLSPDYADAHYNLGLALDEAGDLQGAEREYRSALRSDPFHARARSALGSLLLRLGKLREAGEEFHTALGLDPTVAETHVGLGNLYDLQGRFSEAEAEIRMAIRLNPGVPDAHFNLGNSLLSQGRPAEAEPCFREAIRLKSTFAVAYYNLALALEDQGRSGEAARAYETYLATDPKALDRPEVEKKIARLSLPSR
jgi:tetratricopeptide (TPR) repeat protein